MKICCFLYKINDFLCLGMTFVLKDLNQSLFIFKYVKNNLENHNLLNFIIAYYAMLLKWLLDF